MTILTALEKIKELSVDELKHCIQLTDNDIEFYKYCIRNYQTDRMTKFGIPHMKRLDERKKAFQDELASR
jgi:hypothetical protein